MATPIRLLVVEDKPDDAELTMLALRKGGLDPNWERVETAGELKAALASGGWDAVLSDYTLPEFWAVDALEIVRAVEPDLPFIVVSGTVGEDVAVGMMRVGANDYILKQNLVRLASALERELLQAENRRDRKRSDEALRTSEARYRRLFEAAQDAILIVDPVTRKVFDANPYMATLIGYGREELVGKELWEIGLFRDIEANKAAFRTLQDVGYIKYEDLPLVTRDGREIEVEFVSNVYDIGDARVIQCNIRDITAKKRVEEALRRSEERFRQVVEDQTETVLRFTADGTFTFVNDVFRRTFGKPGEDPLGQSWRAIAHPDDLPMIDGKLAGMSAANPVVVIENRVFDTAGSVRWVEFVNRGFYDSNDRLTEIQVVGRDVTDRKRAEDELRASEQRYRTLVAATAAIVWDSPPSGAFDSDQPAWSAFTGQTLEEHQGWGWLDAIHPDDREMSGRAWAEAVAGRGLYSVEHRVRRADGVYRDMSARAVPILDSGGVIRKWIGIHTDITNRKRAEVSLRESQQRLTLATESAGIGIWDWNAAADEMIWDTQMLVLYGVREPQFTLSYDTWRNGLHPDDRDRAEAEIAAALAGSKEFHTEFRIVWPDGEVRHIEAHALTQRTDGSATRMTGVNWDITDRKRAEEAVRESEQRFRAFMDHSPATAFIKDEEGRILYVSPTWRRQFAPEPSGWEGKTDYDFWPRETADLFRASDLECLARNVAVQSEETARTPTGEELTWLVMKFPLLDGGLRRVGGMAWDITARKRAEDALRLRDRAIRAATQGLIITDPGLPDNPMIYVSPGSERMTGYGADEVLGRNCRMFQGDGTDPAAVTRLREAIRTGEPCTVEMLNYRKDGTSFWNELSISPVRDADGQLTHFVGVQSDVTARRNLEEQFRQAQKMEAVGQLAGGVAHDFNNMLTIINGYSDLLLQKLQPDDPNRELVAEIHEAGERSAGLTRQLLAFSRQQILAPRVLDLNEVAADADKMLRRLIGEDIRLTTTLAPGLWPVRVDPGQVEQVLLNLAVNARDAMPTGGRLTVETRNVVLDESYARSHQDARAGPNVLLSVSDTGVGMPPQVAARVFEPFFTTKEVGKGTGLGLATLYGIVRQSGGHVNVYSEVGVGTTFKVYLPRVESDAGESDAGPVPMPPTPGTETILLVEDEAGVRTLARRVLIKCGYAVLEAADGAAAVRVMDGHPGPIHLLVTDVVMPGVGGQVVAERVSERHPGVRVLFVSGYTDDAVIRHGVLGNGVNFLQKPFSPAALAAKVREVLDAPVGTDGPDRRPGQASQATKV